MQPTQTKRFPRPQPRAWTMLANCEATGLAPLRTRESLGTRACQVGIPTFSDRTSHDAETR